ncbi:MAG: YqiA/YcfP family alpha/beta fold hydrolase [Succinivibrio sp.]
MRIAYIHGLQSGSNARKAVIFKKELQRLMPECDFVSLDFDDKFRQGIDDLDGFVKRSLEDGIKPFLVASSLGGFYALILSLRYSLKTALINPCIYPSLFIEKNHLLGVELENFYTHKKFVVTQEDLSLMKEAEETIRGYKAEDTLVFLQRGDEVLDYRIAEQFFKDACLNVEDGGSHTYDNFESKIPEILSFFKKA